MKYFITLFVLIFTLQTDAFAQSGHEGHQHNSTSAPQSHSGHNHPVNNGKITTPELLTQKLEGDIIYGEQDAPVAIVEYASLSCGHCARFYNEILGKLKENYISNGKVKLTYRHYPLNPPALQAAMLVECATDNKKKQELIGALFMTQNDWAFTNNFNSKLRNIAKESAIKAERFDACIDDNKKQEALLGLQLKAQKELSVQSTPTIFVNGELYKFRGYEYLSKHIDGLLQSTQE